MAENNKKNNDEILKDDNIPAIVGFLFSFLGPLAFIGFILSIVGLFDVKQCKTSRKNLAVAGIIISCFVLLILTIAIASSNTSPEETAREQTKTEKTEPEKIKVVDFSTMTMGEAEKWCSDNDLVCNFTTDYSDTVEKDKFISQSVEKDEEVEEFEKIEIVYSLGHKKTEAEIEAEFKASCSTLDYREVLRNPSDYANRHVYWFGKVSQVISSSYAKRYMIYVNCHENQYASGGYICDDAMYVTYSGPLNLIEDDVIEMWGSMASEAYTYTTVLGSSKTVPEFEASYVTIH